MNGVDIAVVIIVVLLVLAVICLHIILPKVMSRRLKKKGKEENCGCANCKRH
ncbi:MAG: hypothetical protein K2J93_06705 [Anaeroplasmataceae bacterium]|nr:hypothetical protein [Anaeroplasmataceae bacterium]